jgi:hypothetical protein
MISFAQKQLEQFQPRDDYRELLKTSLLYSLEVPLRKEYHLEHLLDFIVLDERQKQFILQ